MKTEIIAITDRSGSMGPLANDVIGGYNTFLQEQQALPGEARMTFVQFDDKYDLEYTAKPLAEAPELTSKTYVPRGYTALLDAIGITLTAQGKRIKEEKWADKVIICIITDGEENASKEYSQERVKEMIKAAEAEGWAFVFLAANQDAIKTAQHYGMSGQFAQNFTASASGTREAYAATSSLVGSLRSAP